MQPAHVPSFYRPQMQEVAGQMRRTNPELFDQLRDHIKQGGQPDQAPPTSK